MNQFHIHGKSWPNLAEFPYPQSLHTAFSHISTNTMGSAILEEVFKEVSVPQQKVFNGVPFPLLLSPAQPASANLAEAVRAHKAWVEAKLHEAGAILFRGFDVATADHFNDVFNAFGYEAFTFGGVAAPRTHVVGHIHTANDSAPHNVLHFHNEISYMEDHPTKGFLYCEVEPGSQGETPIVPGHIVYERLKKKYPDFILRLEEHGLIYKKFLPEEVDISSPVGKSWKSIFATNDKTIAEQKAAKDGWKLEWIENGARLAMGPVPGIKIDNTRHIPRKMWFNSLMMVTTSHVDPRYKSENSITLGDGSTIPPEVFEECQVILEEECVAVPWRHGDILLLDNHAVQHSRRPFTPPRRVLVAFTK